MSGHILIWKRKGELILDRHYRTSVAGLGFRVLSTLLFMYVLTGLLLFVMAFLLYKFKLQENFVMIGIVAVYVVSGFFGGCMIKRRIKQPCAFIGLFLGSVYFLVLFLGSAILNHGFPEDMMRMLATWAMCGCASMLGAMLGSNQ